ncbi:MAG: HD-GYP domain-containing protein [Chitinophagales bacterium]
MQRRLLSDLPLDQALAHGVYSLSGKLLLPQGAKLTQRILQVLVRWGIAEVYLEGAPEETAISQRGSEAPVPTVPKPTSQAYRKAVGEIKRAMESLRLGEAVALTDVGRTCGNLVLSIAQDPDVLTYLHLLHYRDDYTFQHSVRVGVLAVLLGRWLRLPLAEQAQLAIAGSMHDVGKALIPLEILNKPGRLSEPEFQVVKTHPLAGHHLLSNTSGCSGMVARVALEHHERIDGSGYPHGVSRQETILASRIVAVADIYDAMTSDRVYRSGQPEYAVLAQLQEDGFSTLDPQVTRVFVEHLVYSAHGRPVTLSDGRQGRVVFSRKDDPAHPIVAVGADLVDLCRHRHLSLVR